jgi:quercetin dioxygenase-like cupin family protein
MAATAAFRNRPDVEVSARPDGAEVRRVVRGEHLALTEYVVPAGFDTGAGGQEHEKVGYVVRGEVEITTGAGAHLFEAGGGYAIPAGVHHRFHVIEDAVIVQTSGRQRIGRAPRDRCPDRSTGPRAILLRLTLVSPHGTMAATTA